MCFGIGVVCIELATKCEVLPFPKAKSAIDLLKRLSKDHKLPMQQLPSETPRVLHEMVKKCCKFDKSQRSTISDILKFLRTLMSRALSLLYGLFLVKFPDTYCPPSESGTRFRLFFSMFQQQKMHCWNAAMVPYNSLFSRHVHFAGHTYGFEKKVRFATFDYKKITHFRDPSRADLYSIILIPIPEIWLSTRQNLKTTTHTLQIT